MINEDNKELIKLMGLLVEDNLSLRGREDLYKEIILLLQENKELKDEIDTLKDRIEFWRQHCDDLEMQIGCMSDE